MAIPKGISEDTYNSETKISSEDKLYANYIYQTYVNINKNHFYLESKNRLTTSFLMNKGTPIENLYIANGNSETCKEIGKIVHNITCDISTNFLRSTNKKFQTLWMDYCCTMEGTYKFRPIDDAIIIISRRLVQNGGIIGFTFSVRQPKKHWKKKCIKKHKLSTQEIIKKHKIFKNTNINNCKNSRWKHACIDFCESILQKTKCNIEIVNFYRYQYKNGKAPPQMYVFFIKVNY